MEIFYAMPLKYIYIQAIEVICFTLTVQNTVQLPVAIVSRPLILPKCIRYFPYDYYACVCVFQGITCITMMCMVQGTWGS